MVGLELGHAGGIALGALVLGLLFMGFGDLGIEAQEGTGRIKLAGGFV